MHVTNRGRIAVNLCVVFTLSITAAPAKIANNREFHAVAASFNQAKYAQSKMLADTLIKRGRLSAHELGLAEAMRGLSEEATGDFVKGASDIQSGFKRNSDLPDAEAYLIGLTEAEVEMGNIKKAEDVSQDAVSRKKSGLSLVNRAYVSINARNFASALLDIHEAEFFADYPKDIGVKLTRCALAGGDEGTSKFNAKCLCKTNFHQHLKLVFLP